MMFKNILEDLNISKNDFLYLFILTVFSILITYTLINFNQTLGIYCSDVFIYLSNSLVFANRSRMPSTTADSIPTKGRGPAAPM